MSSLWVDRDRCTLCGACLEACPFEALEMGGDGPEANANCTLCGACVKACPEDALGVPDAADADGPVGQWSGFWVMAEGRDGRLHHSTGELLGAAARLTPVRECCLRVVVLGGELDRIPAELAGWPVDEVLLAEDARLEDRTAEHWAGTLAHLVASEHPETILAPATTLWRAVLPRAAAVLHTGLTADCTGLDVSGRTGDLRQTRPAFGGDVMATITCPGHRPEMATVRPGVMSPPEREGSGEPPVRRIRLPDDAFQAGTHLLEVHQDEEEAVNIAETEVIVAGGRGLGGPEGFELLRQAAEELDGEVASSRPPVDAGWIPYPRQVGQTGTTVQPKLYLACGISGSLQHRVGMQSSDLIVAVNTDPDAPIFEIADYGIVGDYRQVLPALTEELKERGRKHVSQG